MVCKLEDTAKAEALFGNWQESLIWSCLQKVMGKIYVDNLEKPESAMAILGDFCFLAGKPSGELAAFKPEGCQQRFIIMVPQDERWAGEIEAQYGDRAKKVTRYAIKKEGDIFDRAKLQEAVDAIPEGFVLRRIDQELYQWCREHDWSRDFVSNYEDFEQYEKIGLGVMALKEGEPVAGASSYSSYRQGIEIEIGTKKEYRRRGLAYACGAKLILTCLERGGYPNWDAQNKGSAALAEKLGYHFSHEYDAYEIWGY